MDLYSLLIETAQKEGFPLAGALDLDLATSFPEHVNRYDTWIQSGFEGSMEYLRRGRDRRANPRLLFPEAQSILCVALPYSRKPAGGENPRQGPRYARYLQGTDYHLEIAEKLERVLQTVRFHIPDLKWKVCVDTSAVLERSWAALAGLGWIGKNTLLIHPKLGSYLFLGEVLLNLKVGKGPNPLPDYCGHCTRCLNACPTQAFPKPRTLNSNRCISYWTLEKRGDLAISSEEKQKIGSWIAGCDSCQEACPFNIKPCRLEENPSLSHSPQKATWRDLLSETMDEYKKRVKFSALNRVKPAQFSRNLALSLFNFLSTLSELERNQFLSDLEPLLKYRFEIEPDSIAKEEWARILNLLSKSNTVNPAWN